MDSRTANRLTPSFVSLARAIGLMAASCAIAGCNSISFGPMSIEPVSEAPVSIRATFGEPLYIKTTPEPAEVRTVSVPDPMPTPIAEGQPIDLAAALRLAGADSPIVALADEAVRASLAEQTQARALLFPTLNAGANLRIHRGRVLTGRGVITDSNLQSLYYGFGADAKGAGTVAVPGLRLVGHLADALYARQAVQRKVAQSQLNAIATRNAVLADVGVAYLELVGAQSRLEAMRQSLKELDEVERLTADFAASGQGRDSDAQRAKSERLLAEMEAERRCEEIDIAAAELARLLDVDPSLHLRAVERVPPLVVLVDRELPIGALLEQAVANHPEIAALGAAVEFQEIRIRQERARPWLPVVSLGFSAGEFGGGNESGATRLGNFSPRTDLDVLAVWSLQNMGLGNKAVQNHTRVQYWIAEAERIRLIDRVRRQIAEAHSLTQSRRQEMDLARNRVEIAQRASRQEIARARNLLARPIEVLASINQLTAARQDLIRAMVGFSQAQIQLYAALGNEPIADQR